ILHAVRILTAGRFARRARRETVYGSFENEVVLILARRLVKDDLVIADELVGPHRRNHDRHRDRLHRTRCGVVARTIVDPAIRTRGSPRLCAHETLQGEDLPTRVEPATGARP